MFENCLLYKVYPHHPLNMWQLVWRSHLDSEDSKALVTRKCGPVRVTIEKFTACHEKAKTGLLTRQIFGKRKLVGSYYSALVCPTVQ